MTETLLRDALATGPFQQFLGLELETCDAAEARVVLRARWRPTFERGPRSLQWHGGVLAAIVDVAGDFALIARLGRGVPTIDLRVDYLRPAIDTDLLARAQALRVGKSVGTVDVELIDKAGALVAAGRGTYSTLERGAAR